MAGRVCSIHEEYCPEGTCKWCEPLPREEDVPSFIAEMRRNSLLSLQGCIDRLAAGQSSVSTLGFPAPAGMEYASPASGTYKTVREVLAKQYGKSEKVAPPSDSAPGVSEESLAPWRGTPPESGALVNMLANMPEEAAAAPGTIASEMMGLSALLNGWRDADCAEDDSRDEPEPWRGAFSYTSGTNSWTGVPAGNGAEFTITTDPEDDHA